MLANDHTDHRVLAVDLSFLCVLGNTTACKIISEMVMFPRENPVALTKCPRSFKEKKNCYKKKYVYFRNTYFKGQLKIGNMKGNVTFLSQEFFSIAA